MALVINSVNSDHPDVVVRRTTNFPPSIWGDRFASFSVDTNLINFYDEQIEILKATVNEMLMASTNGSLENIRFIGLLFSLGVAYHFETEIEQRLANAFDVYPNLINNAGFDLHTVANLFLLFRQHGHPIPCDVFEKFRDSDGKFKEALIGDAQGMLSLYEASQFGMHGEHILDDAFAFTKPHLEFLATQSSPHLTKLITNALFRPLQKTTPRLAAREFISFYEEDESKNETLLKFAKIDFNRLQFLYQEELCQLTRWYRNLDISSNLVYARDRIVEAYFIWGCGAFFEPKSAKARIISSQSVLFVTLLNDTYDAYGTIEELRIFTDAFQRMELRVDELPEYMTCLYRGFLNLFDDWDQELANEGFSYNASYARDAFKELARAYLVEAEWCNNSYVPTVDEYMSNGRITSPFTACAMSFLLGVGEVGDFEWINTLPEIHVAIQEIGRLHNDIVSHEAEQKRGHAASFIECYMKQYGVDKKVAVEACAKRVDDAWKKLNDFVKEDSISMVVLMPMLNFVRSTNVAYTYDDGYTDPEGSLNKLIDSLLIQPIPI